ncbi:methyltransferase [Rhodococcus ruber]|uniref:Methyltransferase n=2 Tax=Rhodococcus ruber TaxID=1830 RepID=A0ABT4MAL1_9NOCA|nr:methyltransferase [Rhodococcus ruber]
MSMADLATPMSIRVAASLDLAEHTDGDGATLGDLVAATGAFAPALDRLLAHLVTVGVFELDPESERYRPSRLGQQLKADAPEGIKPLLDIRCAGGRAELAFVDLLDTIVSGSPAYPLRYGRDFWADLDTEPQLRESFDAQMNWRYRIQAIQIAERYDWGRFTDIFDVGGGDGQLLATILEAHPTVRGRVLDLPPTAAAATKRLSAAGLSDRATSVAGNFFDPIPTGAAAYILSDVLHDWDDDHARAILENCARAAGADAAVVVIEAAAGRGTSTAFDLFMLMCFGGRERTIVQLTELAAQCNLRLEGVAPISDGRTALEFRSTVLV